MRNTTLALLGLCAVTGCGDDDGGGTTATGITTVTAGDGLTGGGSSSVVSLALDFTKVARAMHTHAWGDITGVPAAANCTGGQKATGVNIQAGTVTCAADADTLAGLTCADGQVVTRQGTTFVCATPTTGGGGGGVTSVATGAGLTGGPITSSGTIAVDFNMVAPLMHSHPGLWQAYDSGEYRFDGHIGLGAFPFASIQVDDANAQLILRDREGANPAAIFMDDGDGVGGAYGNIVWQRLGTAVAQIFLSSVNDLVLQSEGGSLRFKNSAATEAMRVDGATGFVGVANSAPKFPLVVGAGDDAPHSDGNMWVNRSSRQSKEGIHGLDRKDYDLVKKWLAETEVVWFHYKNSKDPRARIGLIAEDVPDVLATPDRRGISTGDAIGFLTAAAKQLAGENQKLREENLALEQRLAAMEKRLNRLESKGR